VRHDKKSPVDILLHKNITSEGIIISRVYCSIGCSPKYAGPHYFLHDTITKSKQEANPSIYLHPFVHTAAMRSPSRRSNKNISEDSFSALAFEAKRFQIPQDPPVASSKLVKRQSQRFQRRLSPMRISSQELSVESSQKIHHDLKNLQLDETSEYDSDIDSVTEEHTCSSSIINETPRRSPVTRPLSTEREFRSASLQTKCAHLRVVF
jgi:hypothetical protein